MGDDDEPYLEIMVSEQGFDDVGEIEGEAVSRSDSGKLRVETLNGSIKLGCLGISNVMVARNLRVIEPDENHENSWKTIHAV